jgi:hypothetical protein
MDAVISNGRLVFLAVGSLLVAFVMACGTSLTGPSAPAFRFTAFPVHEGTLVRPPTFDGFSYYPFYEFGGGLIFADRDVYAPADATVVSVDANTFLGTRLMFRASDATRFYLTWFGSTLVAAGQVVSSGQSVGVRPSGGRDGTGGVGLGVINPAATVGFVAPNRYREEILHCDSAVRLFRDDLRATIRFLSSPEDCEGGLNFDISGTLQGNWYLPTVPLDSGSEQEQTRLSFYSNRRYNPSMPGVNMGDVGLGYGLGFTMSPSDPSAGDITTLSGMVLLHGDGLSDLGVQLLDNMTLRTEVFTALNPKPASGFSAKARTYIR